MLGEEIIRKVVVKLEEFSPYAPDHKDAGPLLSGQDKLEEIKPIYSYIEETLPQAANEMLLIAPLDKLEIERADHRVCIHEYEKRTIGAVCTVSLPDDFLRLCSIRLGSWSHSVRKAEHANSVLAREQDNEWDMGVFTKPVVVLDSNLMYCYSVAPGAQYTVREFRYVPTFSLIGEYNDNIAELIALNCAKKVYEIFQNVEGVTLMEKEIKSSLELMTL